jgi:hypothetical protein
LPVLKVGNEFRVKSFWDVHVQKNMGRPGAEKAIREVLLNDSILRMPSHVCRTSGD